VKSRHGRFVLVALPVVLLAGAGWAIHHELAGYSWADLQRAVVALALAALVTAADYLLLSGVEGADEKDSGCPEIAARPNVKRWVLLAATTATATTRSSRGW